MWVDLSDAEVAAVIAAMGHGSVVDKLCERPSAGTGAFVNAAEQDAIDGIYVEPFGVVKRGKFGAHVMCWRWVSWGSDRLRIAEHCSANWRVTASDRDGIRHLWMYTPRVA
ncbi:hypothetical protein [Rhizobium mongolense]|uniref:Uncharacterized protein n=2 Tax=Rhizobium mongolense TaxID=57676 RepID=A0ABR6IXL7_9HYPH|nr:hypothetical protein [Rhizobium mongolense]MBB4232189.1 hypothetical protein [Rhizobium mongolense]TVZ63091.1 hypothetical protein BCL32_3208 [Rhizobium mongolense USDA 1844]